MISISNLTISYGKHKALKDISIDIDQGQCLLLAGANGSGKTTLLRAIAGVLKTNKGTVMIDNIPAGYDTRRLTAYIPATLSGYDSLKLKDAVTFHGSFFRDFKYRHISELSFDMNRKTGSLSRGEKTLFFLSLALSSSPRYLLIDDVLHFLDPYLRDIFLNIIMQLMEEEQLTVMIAAQSAADIEGVIERIVVMDKGNWALDDSLENLKRQFVRIYAQGDKINNLDHLPIIYQRDWEGMKEIYLYPYNQEPVPQGEIQYLTLMEILKAFIGSEYGESHKGIYQDSKGG
jgi:ABC-2 type transport system ATP-binding protein